MPERAQGTPGLRTAAAQEVGRRDLTALAFERRRHSTGCCCYYQHQPMVAITNTQLQCASRSSIRNRRHEAPAAAQEAGRCDLTALALQCRRSAERLQCEGDETANESSAPCWYKQAMCHMSTASPNSLTAAPRQRVRQNSESLTHLSVMCSIYLHQIVVLHSVHLVHTAGCSRRFHATMELRLALDPATEMHCVPCGARIERELYVSTATNRFAANRLLQIACCKLLAANRLLQITCCDSLAFDYVPGYVSDFPYIEFSTQNRCFFLI